MSKRKNKQKDAIDKAYGFFKSDGHEVDRFMQAKQEEIALENRDRDFMLAVKKVNERYGSVLKKLGE
jgi:hypothetical protein